MPISINSTAIVVTIMGIVIIEPIEHIPEEFHFSASDVDFLIPSKFPRQPFDHKAYFSIHFHFEHSPTALNSNLVFGSQELSPRYIIPSSKHVLPPGQQSWLSELPSDRDQTRPPSQLIQKITQKEFKFVIARDGNVEARLRLSGVPGELGPSEVPVELDFLVTVAGQVDGFGAWTIPEEGEG